MVGGSDTPGSGLRVVWRCHAPTRRQWPCSSKKREPVTRLLLRGLSAAAACHARASKLRPALVAHSGSKAGHDPNLLKPPSASQAVFRQSMKVKLYPEQQPWNCEFSNLTPSLIWALSVQADSNQFDFFLCSGLPAFLCSRILLLTEAFHLNVWSQRTFVIP